MFSIVPITFTNVGGQWNYKNESYIENNEDIKNKRINRVNNNYVNYAIYVMELILVVLIMSGLYIFF